MSNRSGKNLVQNRKIYEMQAEICSALAHPIRLEILDLISDGEKTASDLLESLKIPKANLSQHLSVLKDAGVVRSRKEGVFQYVSLAFPKIKVACALVRSLLIEKIAMEEKKNSDLIRELKSQK